eukprot:TRINITY_DN4964_c1_g4_i1.p1 TRINITY_DN4964_c1_g4~~TRINITY_DN4964_c1_g4_i1.p1  ORF type:complete len:558 (-),score=55.91 TRINITY_DN4964_c1_g4_i1:563-2236(-)
MSQAAVEEFVDAQEQSSQLDPEDLALETIGASPDSLQQEQESNPELTSEQQQQQQTDTSSQTQTNINGQLLEQSEAAVVSQLQPLDMYDSRSSLISEIQSGQLQASKQQSEDLSSDEMPWRGHERVFAIFSNAGKPIFNSIGDENSIARITAILSAIMANYHDRGEQIQYVKAGRYNVVFLDKEYFQLVVASRGGEPPEILKLQLDLLHGQIVSLLTNAVEQMYERNPAYDVRTLLKGTTEVLKTLLEEFTYSPAYFLAAYEPLLVSPRVMEDLNTWLRKAAKAADALHVLLLAGDQIVAKVDTKHSMHPNDLLLISNFVQANDSFRHHHIQEQHDGSASTNGDVQQRLQKQYSGVESYSSYSPVCLPHFNPNLFLHAYIYFLDHHLGISLVMVSGNQDSFYQMDESRVVFQQQLQSSGYLRLIQECTFSTERRYIQIETLPVSVGGGPPNSTPLLHFIFRRTMRRQFYRALPLLREMRSEEMQRKLLSFYSKVFTMLRQGNMREIWWAEKQYSILAIQDESSDEIYACFDRCVLKGDAVRYTTALLNYMKTTTEMQ